MNETENRETNTAPAKANGALTPVPDASLSIRKGRLAGSPECLNCGTELQGPFCHFCGQPDRNFMRFFPVLLREFLEDFIDLDSRFARTLKTLLFQPGRLTRNYLEGRRFRYTPPVRLYLFTSIAFFLLAAMLSNETFRFNTTVDGKSTPFSIQFGSEENLPEQFAGETDPQKILEAIESGALDDIQPGTELPDEVFTTDQIKIGGKPWHRQNNPLVIPFAPDFVNDRINDEIAESPEKARRIAENRNLIIDQVFDILPGTMFVLLPVVALLFKFWYLFAKRYYIEHLVYALHSHAFIFSVLLGVLLFDLLANAFNARSIGWAASAMKLLGNVLWIWIPVYLFLSLRRVYAQSRFLTFLKFSAIGVCYLSLLGIVSGIVAVLSFVLL